MENQLPRRNGSQERGQQHSKWFPVLERTVVEDLLGEEDHYPSTVPQCGPVTSPATYNTSSLLEPQTESPSPRVYPPKDTIFSLSSWDRCRNSRTCLMVWLQVLLQATARGLLGDFLFSSADTYVQVGQKKTVRLKADWNPSNFKP